MSHELQKDRIGNVTAGPGTGRAAFACLIVGGLGLIGALLMSHGSIRHFYFAYLVSYSYFLSLSLGAIFFVLIQHLTQAGWSVGTRRIAEIIACAMPVLAILLLPIIVSVVLGHGDLYRWASHGEAEHEDFHKGWFLNTPFFVARCIFYVVYWSLLGVWYWKQSTLQDRTGDQSLSSRMHAFSAPATLLFAFTLTFAAFDLLMSLDAEWFSTMFGIYYFAGCAVGIFAILIVVDAFLQSRGHITKTVTIEHFHDLGKFLFAFTFFWGYIAFSQYMLLWYANIPEETQWLIHRGASTAVPNEWTRVVLILLFCHLLIPFPGLLSRHVKRAKPLLIFWAVWMLAAHWIDLYWLIMPDMDEHVHLGLIEALCFVGVGGIFLATTLWIASKASLSPIGDPRVHESIVFENI